MTLLYNNPEYEHVEEVLKHNPKLDIIDKYGNNALMYAYKYASIKIVEMLIKYNADLSYTLVNAIYNNKIDVVTHMCSYDLIFDFNKALGFARKQKHKSKEIENIIE
jgi:ankyrin repeat protein